MKPVITSCLAACLMLLMSCSPARLPLPTDDLVGTWRTTNFQMGSADVTAYISLAFYDNHHFSFRMDLPAGGDLVRPYKWGGEWSVGRNGDLYMEYEGESGFMGTMSEVQEIIEKFNFTVRNDRLLMEGEIFQLDFNLDLDRVE